MYERIRHFREDKDYTQNDIAKYLQIHQTTYSDYELGNLNIPISMLVKLAELYETSIDYLVALTDDPRPCPRKKKRQQNRPKGRFLLLFNNPRRICLK